MKQKSISNNNYGMQGHASGGAPGHIGEVGLKSYLGSMFQSDKDLDQADHGRLFKLQVEKNRIKASAS